MTNTIEPVASIRIIPNEYYALEGQTVCVIRWFAVALFLSLKNRVLYITDDEDKYNQFKKLVVNNKEYGNDDNALLVKNGDKNYLNQKLYDNMDKFLNMNEKKKFDCTIMNPPWGQLGWKIAYEAWKRTNGKVVCLNSNNILHTLSRFEEKSYFQKYKEMFGCLESETHFTHDEVMKLFKSSTRGVRSTSHVSLTVFGKTYTEPKMTKIEDSIVKHIKENPVKNYQTDLLSKYAVYIPAVNIPAKEHSVLQTHLMVCENKNDKMICCYDRYLVDAKQKKQNLGNVWYECYSLNQHTKRQNALTAGIPFKTFEEAKNFVDSQDTKFMRFVNSKLLTDVHVSQKNIFFMNDYTKPWTDERFKEYFKLTDEEWNVIANAMENIKRSK